jgi:hypothetical protein
VYGNPNLNQNADIILNEVGSTNRSVLNGALEVFGKNAAVVIANPMSLMLPAEILDRCEISMPNSIGAALVFDLTSPVV